MLLVLGETRAEMGRTCKPHRKALYVTQDPGLKYDELGEVNETF